MGSGQSARRLTVENDDKDTGGIVKISDDLVRRLMHKSEAAAAAEESQVPELRPAVQAQEAPVQAVPLPQRPLKESPAAGHPSEFYPSYTLTALQVQQQKEHELRAQEEYWKKRLINLEQSHHKINRIMENEYKKASQELYMTGKKIDLQDAVQPCLENSTKVLKCYQENPKEILKCSALVEEFSNCVDVRRAHVIASRC